MGTPTSMQITITDFGCSSATLESMLLVFCLHNRVRLALPELRICNRSDSLQGRNTFTDDGRHPLALECYVHLPQYVLTDPAVLDDNQQATLAHPPIWHMRLPKWSVSFTKPAKPLTGFHNEEVFKPSTTTMLQVRRNVIKVRFED